MLPLVALALAARRERRARATLGLAAPSGARRWSRAAAAGAAVALLGLAAAQPALRSQTSIRIRTDAQALYVIDVSRSMLASRTAHSATRIARARDAAIALRDQLAEVPSGVANMTDRVIPNLLPVPERDPFEQTVRRAVKVDNPPPESTAVTATTLAAIGAVGSQSFFAPGTRHRIVIVLTDAESRPFDASSTAQQLHGVTTVFVRVGSTSENIFGPDGKPDPAYHPDATSTEELAPLAEAAHATVVAAGDVGAAARAVRASLGSGPTRREGLTVSTRTLAPYVALAALLPVLLLLVDGRRRSIAALRAKLRPA